MHPRARVTSNKQGSALLLIVALLGALGVLLASLLSAVGSSLARRHAEWREQVSGAAAEAGVQHGAAKIAEEGAGYRGEDDLRIGGGCVSITVSAGNAPTLYTVESTGTSCDGAPAKREIRRTAVVRVDGTRIVSIARVESERAIESKSSVRP
jgi:hypothetical protein